MSSLTLLIKNMVCHRCVLAVENILTTELIPFQNVAVSQVQLCSALSDEQKARVIVRLNSLGFELIDNRNTALIERIKQLVRARAWNELSENENKMKLSSFISGEVNHEYTYLSSLFSAVEGRTIENYFIDQRVEKVKELLLYGQLTLSQIAFDLDYSSAAHLSTQFKRTTGLTPTYFRETGLVNRQFLDTVQPQNYRRLTQSNITDKACSPCSFVVSNNNKKINYDNNNRKPDRSERKMQ